MAKLIRAPVCRAGDPGSNPGPGENFSFKLFPVLYDLTDGYFES